MNKKRIFAGAMILLMTAIFSFGIDEKTKSFSLEECIKTALKNNLRISIESYNPELADASLTQAKEMFSPNFRLNIGREATESPSYWRLQGDDTQTNKQSNYSFSLEQKVPTGGNVSLSLTNYKSDTNAAFQLINPRYGTTLRLDLSQPLLKNFGSKISRSNIHVARNNLAMSKHQFKNILSNTIYSVQEAYWNLVYSIENYEVKKQSLQLGRDLLSKNKKEVEVGKLAPIEILNAQTVVAQREADILQAEALIRRNEDVLRAILNLKTEEEASSDRIIPSDKPEYIEEKISVENAIDYALQNRPDLLVALKTRETRELNLNVAKNQMLPALDLNFSYWSPGISGDRLLYLNDNALTGVIIGKLPGSSSDSLRDAFKLLYNNWTVGLTMSFPLSNFTTRAEYTKARIELEKSLVEQEDIEQKALLEVKNAVRDIETNSKRVNAYKLARELAQKRLQAEEKKLRVGLTTNYFVLQFQEELGNARSFEFKAIVDYNLALARLEKATGMSLEKHNIVLE